MSIFLTIFLLLSSAIFFVIYFVYFVMVFNRHGKNEYLHMVNSVPNIKRLPSVSILVPTYNEENVIYSKLQNLRELHYPQDRIEVIVMDDSSTDKTREIAKNAFKELGLHGKVLEHHNRMGVNALYNEGVAKANSEYIVATDADVKIHREALRIAMGILMNLKEVGGVSAIMIPISDRNTIATTVERTYRSFYDSLLIAESAIFSTFPGYTCFTLMRQAAFSPISVERGSSDGNISLSIIKNGFRFICAPNVFFYEPIAEKPREQIRQKVRRAARLTQSAFMNRDMLFNEKYKEFGRFIFPLRFLMLTICPALIFCAIAVAFALVYSFSLILFLPLFTFFSIVLFLGLTSKVSLFRLPASLLIHQAYLLLGLFLSFKSVSIWKQVERR